MPAPAPPVRATPRLRLLSAAGVVAIMGAWAVASVAAGSYFVPAPWTTLVDAALLLSRGPTWSQVGITMARVAGGFVAGFLVGLVAGIAIGSRRELDALFKPLVLFFQGMPPLLWAIPLVALMGIGNLPTVSVIALITFPLVAVTIGEGMSTLPRELGEMLALFAPGWRPRFRELVIPHLGPFLGASLKAGLVLAVKASVTAEYFGANNGIGFQIQSAYMSMRIRSLFAWALVLILVILAFNRLVPRIGKLGSAARRVLADRHPPVTAAEAEADLAGLLRSRPAAQAISVEHAAFAYRHGPPLLRDVTLTVGPGEIAVITGESGIGKTTLLRLVASLLRPTRGQVACPPRIGFVFQDDRLLPWRTVTENTALPLRYQGQDRAASFGMARRLLAEAGLEADGEKRPDELSGGMKKRAALARCFARLPDAILLDEPFSGLHEEARTALWALFLRLHALHPVPVVVVTHYPEEVAVAAGALYEMKGGMLEKIAAR